jgi:hypothetical protein
MDGRVVTYPMFPSKVPTCAIQWIDCRGEPTPDENPAIGLAVLRSDNRKFPICAEHAQLMNAARSHHDAACTHVSRHPVGAFWSFEPLPKAST